MLTILFVRNKNDVNLQTIIGNLDLNIYNISILDLKNCELIHYNNNETEVLFKCRLKESRIFSYISRYMAATIYLTHFFTKHYDVIHILNMKRENFWLFPFFSKQTEKLIVSVYGRSTFLYRSKRLLFSRVLKYVDNIIFTNPVLLKEFSSYYKHSEASKMHICYLPMVNVRKNQLKLVETKIHNFIKKFNIRIDLVRISCSSTIANYEQHDKVVDALVKITNKDKVQLMFLLTYGGPAKEKQVIIEKIQCKLAGFNVVIVDTFLSSEELSVYRSLTDIYINMRTSDQMAGAIIESLYEGSLLLSGAWLNYQTLDDIGINYVKVPSFNELPGCVDKSILDLPDFKNKYAFSNREKIINEFSIERTMKRWNDIYSGNQLDNN